MQSGEGLELVGRRDDESARLTLEALERGQVATGVVVDIKNFGVFVDIGGVIGMINCAELTWKYFDHPNDVVGLGERLAVMVLDVDLDRERVSLSLKALQPDPMADFARVHLGAVLRGEVTRVVPFGVFVAVGDGIQGLVHESALDRTPEVGDTLLVEVVDINLVHRRVRLLPSGQKPS
ncbi:S1 RNA-binding domain-containing protein [Micromonospora sp. NPDC051543]|uniref:S1 RNA-binding domain-containing protein n=1 Tax=Micromonospora sp. NPDC051543 TaxID=3364287 RepID=UPI00379E65E5